MCLFGTVSEEVRMNRRMVLGSVSAFILPLGGCLGLSPGNDSCIRFRDLSSDAQTEVRTAIESGEYDACGGLAILDEISISEETDIRFENTAYEPAVRHGDAGPQAECSSRYTLTMERVTQTQGC